MRDTSSKSDSGESSADDSVESPRARLRGMISLNYMQKTVLWVLAVLIVAGGWFLFTTDSSKTPESSRSVAEQAGYANTNAPENSAKTSDNTMAGATDSTDTTGSSQAGDTVVPATVITYTDAGFNPSSVTIKKGQVVRWMNNSGASVWPASAVHPTHGLYPQKSSSDCLGSSFDACRGLAKGESWDFIFNLVGDWKFHDHLNVSKTGVVKVTE